MEIRKSREFCQGTPAGPGPFSLFSLDLGYYGSVKEPLYFSFPFWSKIIAPDSKILGK